MKSQNEYPTAVVTEMGVGGLSIIRSLGKKGIPVIGIDSKKSNIAVFSKYCRPVFCENVNDYPVVETLLDLGKTFDRKAVLLCSSDRSALTVSKYREDLKEYFTFVLPSHEVIKMLMNKRKFHEFAVKSKLSVPKTVFTKSRTEVEAAAETVGFPCVIKPELRDTYWYQYVPPEDKVLYAASKKEYFEIINNYKLADRPLIVQEWIHGGDDDIYFCLTYIDRDSQPLAAFTGKTVRLYPVFTGLYTLSESLWQPFVAKESLRLLKLSGCIGLCSVEFKFCHKHKAFKITEPTVARVDMQESMATACGVDLPYMAYLDAIGMKQRVSNGFRQGVKWICETVEIYGMRHYLKDKGIKKLLSSYSGKRAYALMDIDDPKPFLTFFGAKLKRKMKNIIKIRKH